MARKRRIPPPDALLCERCGYDLAGLRRADDCPECGKAVVESLPRGNVIRDVRIVGTKTPMLRYWWLFSSHPLSAWSLIDLDGHDVAAYQTKNYFCLSLFPFVAWLALTAPVVLVMMPHFILDYFSTSAAYGLSFAFIVAVSLLLLSSIEEFGVRYFGNRRGFRITKEISATIIAHAMFAWILSIACVCFVIILDANGMIPAFSIGLVPGIYIALFLAFLPGLLWFETLVWIGVRKLRFANIPGSERHLADHGLEARAADAGGDAPVSPDG